MSSYTATVIWTRPEGAPFTDNKYSRGNEWRFDGNITVPASSSPKVVPVPLSRADAVDPEEAFIASLSSCHMLFFLFYAAKGGFKIDQYEDEAIGEMGSWAYFDSRGPRPPCTRLRAAITRSPITADAVGAPPAPCP